MRKVKNYLNNRDILKEIHKSKNSYCSFESPDVANYDIIISDISNISSIDIENVKQLRADRIAREKQDIDLEQNIKRKLDEYAIPLDQIPVTELVFRVVTWEHIPIDLAKQVKADSKAQEEFDEENLFETEYDEPIVVRGPAKYVRVNFPPFKHYKLTEELIPYCVGISHWQGKLDTGEFNKDHGKMTNTLAHMFIKLCERYGTRSNWRGYTYNEEMRGQALLQLSQVGLQFDESKSQNPFAYYTATLTNSFTRVLNTEKRNQNIRDDILEMNNLTPSYTRQGLSNWGGSKGTSGEPHYDE